MLRTLIHDNNVPHHGMDRGGLSARTATAYSKDYDDFARFDGSVDGDSALERLIGLSPEQANALVGGYLAHLQLRNLKSATIARRINALRSAVRRSHASGRIVWTLSIAAPRVPRRKERTPGMTRMARLLDERLEGMERPQGAQYAEIKDIRDRCILRLLGGLKLHRSELVAIDVEDLDLEGGRAMIRRWGRADKQSMVLPVTVGATVARWLDIHERKSGALFYSLHLGRPGARLTADAVHEIIRRLKSQIDADPVSCPRSIGA